MGGEEDKVQHGEEQALTGGWKGVRVCVCVCVYVRRKFWVSLGVCRACAFEERGGGEVVIL